MSDCSRSVFLLSGSVTIIARIFFVFRLYHPRLVSICYLKNVFALWDASDIYILFRLPKSISCAFVSVPFENQFLVWMVILVDSTSFFVLIDNLKHSSILLHVTLFRM